MIFNNSGDETELVAEGVGNEIEKITNNRIFEHIKEYI